MAVVWPSKNNFANGDVLTAANMNNIADTLNVFNPTSATNGQVWTANGSGSGSYQTPVAGGWISLASGNLPTGSGTLTLSSISGAYKALILYLLDFRPASSGTGISCRVNNVSGAATYQASGLVQRDGLSVQTYDARDTTSISIGAGWGISTGTDNFAKIEIDAYATAQSPLIRTKMAFYSGSAPYNSDVFGYCYGTTSAVTRIDVILDTGNFSQGTYVLYGVS